MLVVATVEKILPSERWVGREGEAILSSGRDSTRIDGKIRDLKERFPAFTLLGVAGG